MDRLTATPDGTEVAESYLDTDALQDLQITEEVNTGDSLTVGSCCTAQLELSLISYDNLLDEKVFDGAELAPYVGVQVGDTVEMVPCGRFVAEEVTRGTDGRVTIKAYDKMSLFDVPCEVEKSGDSLLITAGSGSDLLQADYTLADLLSTLCRLLGVEPDSLTFPNADYQPGDSFVGSTTCRNVLSYLAQAAGCFATMTRQGKLRLGWYTPSGLSIGPASAFEADPKGFTVPSISRLLVTAKDYDLGISYGQGEDTYEIKDNPLLYSLSTATEQKQQAVLKAIFDNITGLSYQPLSVTVQGNPALQAGDTVTFTEHRREFGGEEFDVTYTLLVMQRTLSLSSGLKDRLASVGESENERKPESANDKIEALNRKSNVLERTLDKTRSEVQSVENGVKNLRTEIEQTKESLTLSIENTGGSNLISNSCGKGGTADWAQADNVTTGSVDGSLSKSAFILSSTLGEDGQIIPAVLKRSVDLLNGNLYTCSCRYRKDSGTATIKVHGKAMEIADTAVDKWKTASVQIDLRGATASAEIVPVEIVAEARGGQLVLSDLMLCQGESTVWTQAPNEIYGAGYRFDKDGLTITNNDVQTQLVADAMGTRVRDTADGEDIAAFTTQGTITKKLQIKEEMSMGQAGACRMIPLEEQDAVMFVIND